MIKKFIYFLLAFWVTTFSNLALSDLDNIVSLEVRLEKYDSVFSWHQESEASFDDGVAPLASFIALKPKKYSSKEIKVLFNSQHYEAFLPTLEKDIGKTFIIDVPADFLENNAIILDAMYVRTIKLKNP